MRSRKAKLVEHAEHNPSPVGQLSNKAAEILRISVELDKGGSLCWVFRSDIPSGIRVLSIEGHQQHVRLGKELAQWHAAIAELLELGFIQENGSDGLWILTAAGWDRGEQLLEEHRREQLSAAARKMLVMIHDRGEGVCLYQRMQAGRFLRIKGQPPGGTHGRDISKWDAALRELEERGFARSDQPGMVKRPGRKRYAVRLTEDGYAEREALS